MKTKSWTTSASPTYSVVFLSIFLGSLLMPFLTVSAGLTGLVDGFKSKIYLINAFTESRLWLGDQVFNQTLVGSDGWLYLTNDLAMASYQRAQPLSRKALHNSQLALEEFQRQVEAGGSVLLFVVAPDKQTIYPEHMPATLPRNEGFSPLDQLIHYLADNKSPFHILDLRPALLNAKQTHPVYFATDSHWNPFGAFVAYQQIIAALQPSFPGLSPRDLSEYNVKTGGPMLLDLSKTIGSTSLTEAPFDLLPPHPASATIHSIDVVTHTTPRHIYLSQTDDQNAPTALVLDDSFFVELRPFISEHFSSAVYIDHFATPAISAFAWYKQFHPDVVIFELTERNIGLIPVMFGK